MKVLLLGFGIQGKAIAFDLASEGHLVYALDKDPKNFRKIKKFPRAIQRNIQVKEQSIEEKDKLIMLMKQGDITVSAVPGRFGRYLWECAMESKTNLVDISYCEDDPLIFTKDAQCRKIKIVPDAGFAPGLSNILVGSAYRRLNKIREIKIYVGNLPQHPRPPFKYHLTWSLEDLINEYLRPARIVKDSKIIEVPALSGIETIFTNRLGKLEAFYTDGLRTLLKTIKHVSLMEEKTVRYPGHAELIRGLLNYSYTPSSSKNIKPQKFVVDFLRKVLEAKAEKDLSILIVKIRTPNIVLTYRLLDFYDEKTHISSMARLTGFTASVITQIIPYYQKYGIIPPEFLGMHNYWATKIIMELKKRKIYIKSQTQTYG
jgi:saccharopine dehydrogenase-like NADP-dependent oxidoreductase